MPNEATATDIVVKARQIEHAYDAAQPVLRGVDFTARRGTLTVLAGANGSGKSTLVRILAGVLEPSSGEVHFADRALATRGGPGYVAQDAALDPEMTGGETLELFAALYGLARSQCASRIAEVAASIGLEGWLDQRIDVLSGGQRRRLHLAAGMLHDPELLCLDEPGVGLDPDGVTMLWAELERRARAGCAVVIVSHDLITAERHAGVVAMLEAGRVAAIGPPAELIAAHPPDLQAVYRHVTGRAPESEPRVRRGRRARRQ
ncbi:MAG: ABC transporter ATP-binding protein [Acidobacteriota bacterium]